MKHPAQPHPQIWNPHVPSWNLICSGGKTGVGKPGIAEKDTEPWPQHLMHLRPKEISHGSRQSVPALLLPVGPGYAFPFY